MTCAGHRHLQSERDLSIAGMYIQYKNASRSVQACPPTIPTTDRQEGCRGMTLGLKARSGAAIAQPTRDHPGLVKLIAELGEQLPRGFLFSTAYVTQDSQFDPHCDGSNAGDSAIACVGDYTGGELYVAGCTINTEPAAAQVLDARGCLQFFDGNRCHATLPFEGTRYSVIYYCQKVAYEPGPTSSARGVTPEMRAELSKLGFRMPPAGEAAPAAFYEPADKAVRETAGAEQYRAFVAPEPEDTPERAAASATAGPSKTIKKKKKARHVDRYTKRMRALDRFARDGYGIQFLDGTVLTGDLYRKTLAAEKSTRRRKAFAADVSRKLRSGYIDVPGISKATGGLRSCMQDAALNGAARIGVAVDKKTLYRECPVRRTTDRSIEQIEAAPCMGGVAFEHVNLHQSEGGAAAALVRITDGGVYMVLASVEGATTTMHAFVYDSGHVDEARPQVRGAIIDNRKRAPVRLLEASDRASVGASRAAIDTFFGATTFVVQVYRVCSVADKRAAEGPAGGEPAAKRARR